MSQYKKELDAEQKMIADLKKQMETNPLPTLEAELAVHEQNVKDIMANIEEERKKIKDQKEELELRRLNPIPFFHNLLKEYVKDAMKKGSYKEIDYQPITIIPFDELGSDYEDSTIEDL